MLKGVLISIPRTLDIAMLQIQNSRERGEEDWVELFSRADERFKFLGVKHPSGSKLAIITALWDDGGAK